MIPEKKVIDPALSREELRVKMCELQNEAHQYRMAIEVIDKAKDEEKRKKLLGTCFRYAEEYFRVDGFNPHDLTPIGPKITVYGDEVFNIRFNGALWEDDIEKADEIVEESVFLGFLQKAKITLEELTNGGSDKTDGKE